jgi:long-chain acyl-CoA synthetase
MPVAPNGQSGINVDPRINVTYNCLIYHYPKKEVPPMPPTIVNVLMENARQYPDRVIIKHKPQKGGSFTDLTWSELHEMAAALCAGLIDQGLEPGDRVALLSYNRLEWIVADLAVLMAGGVDVPIYHTNTAEQCQYIIKDAGAKFVVVEDQVQLEKVATLDVIPILIEPGNGAAGDSFSSIMEKGRQVREALSAEMEKRLNEIKPDSMATIVYTSGTTGPPKGCMISHENTIYVLDSIDRLTRIDPDTNLSLLVLPLSHFYPRVSGYYYNLFKNVPLAMAESIDTLSQDIQAVRPTYFCSVPRILEKVHARIEAGAHQGSALQARLFDWAVQKGRVRSQALLAGKPLSVGQALAFKLADRLVLSRIRDRLGGRLAFAVSAGAPLSAEVGEFVHSLGIQVLEFYGLTETLGGTMTTFEKCRYGTVGMAMPGFEVRLAEDGEILIRGNNFMGYFNRPDLTAQAIHDDGWCYTGDVGQWDEDGFLKITDRKKDLIITSGGKNISPQNLENMLKTLPLVANAMVHGDQRKYLTALITLEQEDAEAWAKARNIQYQNFAELTQNADLNEYLNQRIQEMNQGLARFETIKRFAVLERDFSQEDGEITPTLKVRRKVVTENYRHLLEAMYKEA